METQTSDNTNPFPEPQRDVPMPDSSELSDEALHDILKRICDTPGFKIDPG